MKKINIAKSLLLMAVMVTGVTSCEDFLNRPPEDSATLADFYQTDEQCFQAVNPIYNSPWHDFTRAFLYLGDVQSGNLYMSSSAWMNFSLLPSDDNLRNMSAALYAVNGHCNSAIANIQMYAGPNTTAAGRNAAKGEALVWKATAYFFMVRIWGAVPIIHDNAAEIAAGNYNTLKKAKIENVYDYIIMTLNKAIEWLPEKASQPGRIDRYSAYGLLAKVYLTKSGYGQNGTRSQADLDKAKEYAGKVVNESGRVLLENPRDVWRLQNNTADESLLAWRWTMASQWTASNPMQPDIAIAGFAESAWGDWTSPSLDLQAAFGETPIAPLPAVGTPTGCLSTTRNNADLRRKSTMMMYGDHYDYFHIKDGGFTWNEWYEDKNGGGGTYNSPTGANVVKHLVGTADDHLAQTGVSSEGMKNNLATHILRLADVYLIYAEAILGNAPSTSDAEALKAFNAVRTRACGAGAAKTSLTFDDIWNERRLELALEGDFWYDFVRLHYYKPDEAINKIRAQNRKSIIGLSDYFIDNNKTFKNPGANDQIPRLSEEAAPNVTHSKFEAPFPDTDLAMNPNLTADPVDYDIKQYSYE
jgi:hypothetical protein